MDPMPVLPEWLQSAARLRLKCSDMLEQEITTTRKGLEDADYKSKSKAVKKGTNGSLAARHDVFRLEDQLTRKIKEQEAIEKDIRALVEPYAKETCLALCAAVYHGLPREIRDYIYNYTHANDTLYVGPEYMHRTVHPPESDRDAHYWDANYVGQDMVREMVESWYRTSLFYFYDKVNNASVVDRFLVTDRWNLGLKPRDFIRKVKLELGPNAYYFHDGHTQWNDCRFLNWAERLTEPLQYLHQLPNHVHFTIRVHTHGALRAGCFHAEELQNLLDILIGHLREFRRSGHRLVVQWVDLEDLEISSRNDELAPDVWLQRLLEVARVLR
ncbi:hypothetical protein ACN47E_000623 [Coniothyrium glycines]